MKNILFISAFIISLIVMAYQYTVIKKLSSAPQIDASLQWENNLLKEGFFQSYNYDNVVLNYSMELTNAKGEATKLEELLSGKNNLVLFTQVGSCKDCIYDNIVFAKELKKDNVNIVMGVEGLTEQAFKSFVQQYELADIAYRMPDKSFSWFSINPAVFFVVDKNLSSKYFYAPSVIFPDLTKEYFNVLEGYINLK